MEALCALMAVTSDPDHAPDMSEYNVMLCLRRHISMPLIWSG